MIEDRWRRWGDDEKMRQHFKPITLFREEKFALYLAEAAGSGDGHARDENWKKETFINA